MIEGFQKVIAALQPVYIFTVLATLFAFTLFTITHATLASEVEALLNTALGSLGTMLGTVVYSEFNAQKRSATTRANDNTPPTADTATNVPLAAPIAAAA